MELRKRKETVSLSVDQLLCLLNAEFIESNMSLGNRNRQYGVSVTCFEGDDKRFVASDTKQDLSIDEESHSLYLPIFYGSTSAEALNKALNFKLDNELTSNG